jgi:zinc-ribbon domain
LGFNARLLTYLGFLAAIAGLTALVVVGQPGIAFLLAVLGLIPAWIASRRGHSFFVFWIMGTLLIFVALPLAFTLPDARPRCPECAEVVDPDATVCPYCRSPLDDEDDEPE